MERRAMCKNVGVCSRANKVQIITDDDQELKCPECSEEMELVPTTPPPPPPGNTWKKIAIAAVAIAAIGGGAYFGLSSGGDNSKKAAAKDTVATQPADTVKPVTKDSVKAEPTVNEPKPEVDKTKPEPKPEPKPETKTPKPKSWSSYASFDGSTMTFKKAHRIPGTSRVAQPGDKVQGKWVDGEVNLVRWYHADGSPSETLTHE